LGFDLFGNRAGGGVVRIYRHRFSGRGHCKISLFYFPGYLPGFFHSRRFRRKKTVAVLAAGKIREKKTRQLDLPAGRSSRRGLPFVKAAPMLMARFHFLQFHTLLRGEIGCHFPMRFRYRFVDTPSGASSDFLKLNSRFIDNW
jgi:hypothetical protein